MKQIHELLGLDLQGSGADRELQGDALRSESMRLYSLVEDALVGLPAFREAAIEHVLYDTSGDLHSPLSFEHNDKTYELVTESREVFKITEYGKGLGNSFFIRSTDSTRSYSQRLDGVYDPSELAGFSIEVIDASDTWEDHTNSKRASIAIEKLVRRLQVPSGDEY